ncbi:MAG: hypothetical protein OQL08_07220 [Gammaproteobacteria bacterium]|nr:hypothetical protein [Gammaproteobacteria bacterium]
MLYSLSHRDPRVFSERPRLITFSVLEQMKEHAKQCIEVAKEITLHQEQGGKWRVVREQVLRVNAQKYCAIN